MLDLVAAAANHRPAKKDKETMHTKYEYEHICEYITNTCEYVCGMPDGIV